DLLGAGLQVGFGGFLGQEQAGRLDDDVGADFVPLQLGRVLHGGQADGFAIDNQGVAVHRDLALEAAVHRVVLQHVGQVIGLQQVVDADDLDVIEILDGGTEHHAANATEAVDTDLDSHDCFTLKEVGRRT